MTRLERSQNDQLKSHKDEFKLSNRKYGSIVVKNLGGEDHEQSERSLHR
jgi:hypothetical protein